MNTLTEFNEKFIREHKCELCNLEINKGENGRIWGSGKLNSLFFCGLSPTFWRRGKTNNAFEDDILGKFMDECLKKISLSRNEVYFTNILKESTKDNELPSNEVVDEHFKFLIEEIKLVNPTLIILMGNDVNSIFKENGASIGSNSEVVSFKSFKCIKIRHPSFIKRNNLYREYDEEFKKINDLLKIREYWKGLR